MRDRMIHGYVIDSVAEAIKNDVLQLCRDVPAAREARSFSDLHDYCDANLLGDAEDIYNHIGADRACDVLNAAQTIVDEWLQTGAHDSGCDECRRSYGPDYTGACDH
jgi:hypothetical protein